MQHYIDVVGIIFREGRKPRQGTGGVQTGRERMANAYGRQLETTFLPAGIVCRIWGTPHLFSVMRPRARRGKDRDGQREAGLGKRYFKGGMQAESERGGATGGITS